MREFTFTRILSAGALASSLALTSWSQAQSIGIGEATLRFEAVGSLGYYSNPYLRDKAFEVFLPVEDSFAFVLDPTVVLEMGDEKSRYQLSGDAGVAIRRFESISELDAEDLHFEFKAAYRGNKSRWNFNAATQEISLPEQHTRRSNFIPTSDQNSLNWDGSYRYSARTRFTGGFNFNERKFADSDDFNYTDWESFSVPVRFLYQLTEKLELGGGVRYRDRKQENVSDLPSDLAWHLALEGELTSKLTADVKIGILDVSGSGLNTGGDGKLFLSAQTRWQATSDASITLSGESDNYVTGLNDSVQREQITLRGDWRISTKLSASASISQMTETFDSSTRKDTVNRASAALNYVPQDSPFYSSVALNYEKNDSNLLGFDYNSLVLNWTSAWRF